MNADKIRLFMELAGQPVTHNLQTLSETERKLGAQLLLSEVLEYVIHGLGITPEVKGIKIDHPEELTYLSQGTPDKLEMVDGIADVAYTMYWNACAFGIPIEEAFKLVCENNLDKFIKLESTFTVDPGPIEKNKWHCGLNVNWPPEVVSVEAVKVNNVLYAVGKDQRGKVRKPSTFKPVRLECLLD